MTPSVCASFSLKDGLPGPAGCGAVPPGEHAFGSRVCGARVLCAAQGSVALSNKSKAAG
jgi:hypothetical protein